MHLVVGVPDETGILLVYYPLCCPTVLLPELVEVILDVVLRAPRLVELGDIKIHTEANFSEAV